MMLRQHRLFLLVFVVSGSKALKMNFDEIYFKQASPAIAVNCGAGTFGLLYMEK